MNKLYNEQDIQNIATAIRTKNSSAPAAMKVREMDQAILDIPTGGLNIQLPDLEPPWTRPKEWPDLDALWEYDPDDKGTIWLTYIKNDETYWGYGFYIAKAVIDVGYLDSSDNFVILDTVNVSGSGTTTICNAFPDDRDIMLVRVTGHSSFDEPLTYFAFCEIPTSKTGLAYSIPGMHQCCYEMVGSAPYRTVNYNATSRANITMYMEHHAFSFGQKIVLTGNVLNYYFQYAVNLRKIDFDNFDTSDWVPAQLACIFMHCWTLQELDFTPLDTSNWKIAGSISQCFTWCRRLEKINFGNMDTSKWYKTSTRRSEVYAWCQSLKELDLSFRDMTDSIISTVASEFYGCFSLQKLKLGNIDTSKWTMDHSTNVVNLVFSSCSSLKEIDLSKIDTRLWPTTHVYNMASVFEDCQSLKKVTFGPNCIASHLQVSSVDNMFQRCMSLEEVNIEQLGELHIYPASATAGCCVSMFRECPSLKHITLPNITIESNSTGRGLSYAFAQGCSVDKLDLSNVDNEKCPDFRNDVISTIQPTPLKEFHFPKYVSSTYSAIWFSAQYELEELYPPENGLPDANTTFISTNTYGPNKLSAASVHRIIQALPQATGTKQCTLGVAKRKLTAEDIAIAVEKGWTIA